MVTATLSSSSLTTVPMSMPSPGERNMIMGGGHTHLPLHMFVRQHFIVLLLLLLLLLFIQCGKHGLDVCVLWWL